MKTDIFLPKTLKVGFQERNDTYTKKLAYVIYYDAKGKLRKEASWESWREREIDPMEIDNVPTSGFVLNKKAGGYSTGWNHRQTYVRIFDPRGFEFEISVHNLLYILENTNSIKGKGLEGEFVYGWSGTELILIPTASPDYKEITEINEVLHSKTHIKAKELILGATYKTKKGETYVYMGRFDAYDYGGEKKKKYFFLDNSNPEFTRFETLASLGDKIVVAMDENPISDYAEKMEELEGKEIYSPYDPSKNEYIPYKKEEFLRHVKKSDGWLVFYGKEKRELKLDWDYRSEKGIYEVIIRGLNYETVVLMKGTTEEIFDAIQPMYVNQYLKNGRFYHSSKK